MEENISLINSRRLARLSVAFCQKNGLSVNAEIGQALADAVVAACAQWYADNGMPDFDPKEVVICEEAMTYAFERMQMIATLAAFAAMFGIDPMATES